MNLNRTISPVVHPVEKIGFRMPVPFVLDSGARIHLIEEGDQDVVRIEWIFWKGSWDQQKMLQAYACSKMLQEGAAGLSSHEIAETIQYHGAFLDERVDYHSSSIILYTLTKHLPKLLPLVRDLMTKPDFPSEEFDVLMNRSLQEHRIDSEKVMSLARRNFNPMIFGEQHPYGHRLSDEDFGLLEVSDAAAFHSSYYHPSVCDIIVAGRYHKAFFTEIETLFGSEWRGNDVKVDNTSATQPGYNPQKVYLSKPGALQAAIRIGKPLFNRKHPDHHAFYILNTLLGGYFGSRLMSNLREDKGFTYGVGSGLMSLRNGGLFFVSSQVGANHHKEAVAEITTELKRLCDEPVSVKELETVKNYLWGSLARSFDGPFAKAERLRTYLEYGQDAEELQKLVDTLKNIDGHDLQNLAIKHLDPGTMSELVVGP